MTVQKEKATVEQRIRELETDVGLQTARAEATAAALRLVEDQRAVDATIAAEQHKEELTAAQSKLSNYLSYEPLGAGRYKAYFQQCPSYG